MKKVLVFLLVVVALIAAVFAYLKSRSYKGELVDEVVISTGTVLDETPVSTDWKISVAELKSHNNVDDCWVEYKGSVYDVTSYLPLHPGWVNTIAQFCGTEKFEKGFTKKHGDEYIDLLKEKSPVQGEVAGS